MQLFTGDGSMGALNLFSPEMWVFDAEDRGEAQAATASMRSAGGRGRLRHVATSVRAQ